jgi:hypothetical protein
MVSKRIQWVGCKCGSIKTGGAVFAWKLLPHWRIDCLFCEWVGFETRMLVTIEEPE